MRASTAVGRVAAVVALGAAAVVVALLLLNGGSTPYTVTAEFENASQLVKGNQVVIGGTPVGKVTSISLGPQGQALVEFTVDDAHAPLPAATTATIRSYSLSSIAGRQLQLTLPPAGGGATIPSGGLIDQSHTVSEVDLDQLFNTLNRRTITDFKHVIQGFATAYEGIGRRANRGYRYMSPFLSTSRRVFDELTRDTPALERLIVDTDRLSGALAERAPDLAALVRNASRSLGALASQKRALAASVARLPAFMREANTTFVNLRATLSDLDPLVAATRPVAPRLRPFFRDLRHAARDAVPTIRDLNAAIRSPGPDSDLVELTRKGVSLRRAGVGSGPVDCGQDPKSDYLAAADNVFTQGALSEARCSLQNGLPSLAFFRAYQPELVGWFNDFGTSGVVDANGGIGRISTTFNVFSLSASGVPNILGPPADLLSSPLLDTGNNRRCPGANERPAPDGSNPYTEGGTLPCDPSQIPPGS